MHALEEILRGQAAPQHVVLEFLHLVVDEQAAVRALVVELREDPIDRAARDADPEVLAGHALHHVRLVADDDVVVRQQARPAAPQCEIGK